MSEVQGKSKLLEVLFLRTLKKFGQKTEAVVFLNMWATPEEAHIEMGARALACWGLCRIRAARAQTRHLCGSGT